MKPYKVLIRYILYISLFIIRISPVAAEEMGAPIGFGGLGLQLTIDGSRIVILGVLPNTPAEQAELVTGSTIVAIDGESTAGKTLEEVVKKLRGEVGTSVRLTIIHPRAFEVGMAPREIELKRAFIPVSADIPLQDTTMKKPIPVSSPTSVRGSVTYYITTIPKSGQITVASPVLMRLMVDNPKGAYADTMAIQITFDPQIFTCSSSTMDINTSLIAGWNIETVKVNSEIGKIYLDFRNPSPSFVRTGHIAECRLIPKRATNETMINYQFNTWEKYPNTVLLYRGRDILGNEVDHKDGTIGIRLRIDKE